MINPESFLQELNEAIDKNKIVLPTLPEVALKVREEAEKENTTAKHIADIVATDGAVSARLLQVANSPLYRGRVEIDNIQMAVARMGIRLVRSLVSNLAMKQVFQATSKELDQRFRATWNHATQVASLSHFLAQQHPHLDREQAMLGGLIHNIGALPIFVMAEQKNIATDKAQELDQLINELAPVVGARILTQWRFPESLVQVAGNYRNFRYDSANKQADYADVVIVSRLQILEDGHPDRELDWSQIPAFAKVGVEAEEVIIEMEGAEEAMEELGSLLN